MIKINCHTNLDLRNEQWPTELPAVPRVGDRIVSSTGHRKAEGNSIAFHLELEVVAVRWTCNPSGEYHPMIELHVPSYRKEWSIQKFYEWYAPLVGTTVGAFI